MLSSSRICRVLPGVAQCYKAVVVRPLSTLPSNPSIYIHPNRTPSPTSYTLSLLSTSPPTAVLALGTATSLPPTPSTFTPNPHFTPFLSSILRKHATHDSHVRSQASGLSTSGGSSTGSPTSPTSRRGSARSGGGSISGRNPNGLGASPGGGNASGGGGASGGGSGRRGGRVGGYIHVSDSRNPPDFGRIAWPEDIFGSLEVDADGEFVGEDGGWQDSGSYRVVTNEGILGLTPFLMGKLRETLEEEERRILGKT